jgi:hypothetical protein
MAIRVSFKRDEARDGAVAVLDDQLLAVLDPFDVGAQDFGATTTLT